MLRAGHSESFREVVLTRILARYDNNVRRDNDGTKQMYRSMAERRTQRETEGKKDKANWFREGGFIATLTVPMTINDTIVTAVKTAVTKVPGPKYTKTKVLEKPGVQSAKLDDIKNLLCTKHHM